MSEEGTEYDGEQYEEPSKYMMPQCARGKGKLKGCLAIRDMYKYYVSITDKEDVIDYKTFAKITKTCNKELINQVVNNSEEVQLPYRLGSLRVCKMRRTFIPYKKNKWTIDYKKSREEGVLLYHDTPFIYKWKWMKHHSIVINKTGYKFRANRAAKREIAQAIKVKKVDYFA
jgi:hypothetical protein